MRVAAALSLFALSSPATTAAGTCAPRARLDGDREAVTRVGDELHRLGVATEPAPAGCSAIEADVQIKQGGGISVAIRDASRRSEGRVVGDAAVAAAWIDSWVRDDLGGFDEGVAAPSSTPPSLIAPPMDRDLPPTTSTAPSLLDRVALRASYAHAWTGDGSTWDGFDVAGCVQLGFACIGARATALFQSQVASDAASPSRSDLAAFATASTTLSVGRMALVPEIGLGLGRLDTSRVDACMIPTPAPGCDPTTDPNGANCPPPPKNCVDASGAVSPGTRFEATTYSPRAAASLHIEIPLFDHVWLDGGASIVLAPLHHGDPFQPMPSAPDQNPVALPGESLASYQVGIGLRIGAP